jgi:hypothetical protein
VHENYQGWEEIPEEMITQAAEMAENLGAPALHDNMNFKKILTAGSVFKEAGLTPCYVWCDTSHRLAVYARELYGKKLH